MFLRHPAKLGLASLALLLTLAQAAWAEDKVTFQYSWIPTGEYAPFSAGIAMGFFKDAGIDLQTVSGRGSGDAVKRVAGGSAQFGDGDISAVMTARVNENAPVRCFMAQHNRSPHSVFVLESSGISSLAQLAGKTLVTTPGNSHFLYFPALAKKIGIDPASVHWVTAEAAAMGPMLISKRVAGAPLFATHEAEVEKPASEQGEHIRVLPYADYGFRIYSYCWYTRDEVMKAQPDLVRRFAAATMRSFLWAREHPQEAVDFHVKRHPEVPRDEALATMQIMFRYMFDSPESRSFGRFDPKQLADTYSVVADAQNLPKDVDPATFVDQSFLPPAAQ